MPYTPDGVGEELERRILSGELQPGVRLPSERKLAEQFAVSRPVIREALRGLVARRLVEIQPARGTFVTDGRGLDAARPMELLYRGHPPTVRQLVEAREMLESRAAALAAERATREDVLALGAAVDRMEAAREPLEYVRNDLAFHLALARASHNPVIEIMFGSIAPMIVALMIRSAGDTVVRVGSGALHREAYEAILVRDGERAAELLRQHQHVAFDTFGADTERPVEQMARLEVDRLLGGSVDLDELVDDLLDRA